MLLVQLVVFLLWALAPFCCFVFFFAWDDTQIWLADLHFVLRCWFPIVCWCCVAAIVLKPGRQHVKRCWSFAPLPQRIENHHGQDTSKA